MNNGAPPVSRGPLPPAYFLIAILLIAVLHFFVPIVQFVTSPWRVAGSVPIVVGVGLNVWTDRLFNRAGTAVRPFEPSTTLLVEGPFRFSRNPMYLGMTLILAGIATSLGSVSPWLVVVLFIWQITERFIVPEERKLERTFGHQYQAYRAKVPRWL